MRVGAPQIVRVDPRIDWSSAGELELCPIRGMCLAPLIVDGDFCYVDRTMRPHAGDYALIDMLVGRVSKIDGSLSQGRERGLKKVVRKSDGSWWYWCNDAEFRSAGHIPRGVIVLVVRYPVQPAHGDEWTFEEIRELFETRRAVAAAV